MLWSIYSFKDLGNVILTKQSNSISHYPGQHNQNINLVISHTLLNYAVILVVCAMSHPPSHINIKLSKMLMQYASIHFLKVCYHIFLRQIIMKSIHCYRGYTLFTILLYCILYYFLLMLPNHHQKH